MKKIFAASLPFFAATSVVSAQEQTVNVFAWADVFSPAVLEKFSKETGIHVTYDTTPSDEITETKVLAGKSGYDVVGIAVRPFVPRLITAGALTDIDLAHVPNMAEQDPDLVRHIENADVRKSVGLNYWGTTGFALTNKAKQLLPQDAPLDSLALVFEPRYAQQLHKCGLSFLDSPEDMIPLALQYLGLDPDSSAKEDLLKAEQLFASIKPFITKFDNVNYRQALANGDICAAVGWGGDIILARDDTVESKQDRGIEYRVPKEGGLLWMNGLVIPKDAPNSQNAQIFINFMLSKEVGADLALRGYSPAVPTALLPDQTRYPNSAERARLHYITGATDTDALKRKTSTWTNIKYK